MHLRQWLDQRPSFRSHATAVRRGRRKWRYWARTKPAEAPALTAERAAQSLEEASPSAALKPLTFSLLVSSAARHIPAGQGPTIYGGPGLP